MPWIITYINVRFSGFDNYMIFMKENACVLRNCVVNYLRIEGYNAFNFPTLKRYSIFKYI